MYLLTHLLTYLLTTSKAKAKATTLKAKAKAKATYLKAKTQPRFQSIYTGQLMYSEVIFSLQSSLKIS